MTVRQGFTLAELLIALAILGVIATFTIPKVLNSQQSNKSNAVAKEVAGMLSGALTAYKQSNTVVAGTTGSDLTPYMNYVKLDTVSVIDDYETDPDDLCSDDPCLLLHNGARLMYGAADPFGGTQGTSAIWFQLDPDGVYGGSTTGPSKSVVFWLYANGRITTYGSLFSGTMSGGGSVSATPAYDPTWFSWN